jgi:hypothetical protein
MGREYFIKITLFFILDETKLINANAFGKENNIEISLRMQSLSCTYFTSYLNLNCGIKIPVHSICLYSHKTC